MSANHYFVGLHGDRNPAVEAWSGYPLQFEGQRRFPWQDEMAAELKATIATLTIEPGETVSGTYMTTDPAKCDVENRLYTNPGSSTFPKGITSTSFERGIGDIPEPPVPIARVSGHVHYYRYRVDGGFESWEPRDVIARWTRVPRMLPGDGSCRPIWFALRHAAAAGEVEVLRPTSDDQPLGIRLVVHARRQGPRSAPVISETLVDGMIAAFHGPPPNPGVVAEALAPKLAGTSAEHLEQLLSLRWPGNLFPRPPFNVTPTYVQISPDDERVVSGEVTITPDASGRHVEISGELFMVQPRPSLEGPRRGRRLSPLAHHLGRA